MADKVVLRCTFLIRAHYSFSNDGLVAGTRLRLVRIVYAVAQQIIHQRHANLKYQYGNRSFGAEDFM